MLQNSVRPAGVPLIRDSRKNDFLLKEFRGSPAALGGHGALNFRWSVFSDLIRSQYPVFKVRRAGSCAAQGGTIRRMTGRTGEENRLHKFCTSVHVSNVSGPGAIIAPPRRARQRAPPAGADRAAREWGGGPEREGAAAPGPGWGPGAAAWGAPRGAGAPGDGKCPSLVSDVLLSHGLTPQYHRRSGA